MNTPHAYTPETLSRAEVDAHTGPLVLEFGTNWCGHCVAAQAPIAQALRTHAAHGPALAHIKVEDGAGRPLGRSFRVKLWPTLVVLKNGQEVARVVRPSSAEALSAALEKLR